MVKYYTEDGNSSPGLIQKLLCEDIICEETTGFQDVVIFNNPVFGKVLALDKVIQTTENDEFIYHETIVHFPMLAHGAARRVLIIGAGDGGVLRQVMKYPYVREAVMVEIDKRVIELAQRHLPEICGNAFEDPRAKVVVGDAYAYMAENKELFDVIIIDSSDPVGPAQRLFAPEFYGNCKRSLTPGGALAAQAGVPFLLPETARLLNVGLKRHFADVAFYLADIPSFVAGPGAFAMASDNPALRQTDENTIAQRLAAAGVADLKYVTPALFGAAFVLPRYIQETIDVNPRRP